MIIRFFLLMMMMVLSAHQHAWAASKAVLVQKGNEAFSEKGYAESIEFYQNALQKDAESDIINFNLGTALYKQGHYEQAVEPLHKALLSEEVQKRQQAYYNLGNTYYQLGKASESSDLDATEEQWISALKYYEQALKINMKDEDARYNYEFVQRKLDELKQKQQNQQQNQEQQNQEQQNQEQQNQQQQNQNQQQQDQQQNQQEDQQNQNGQNQNSQNQQDQQDQQEQNQSGQNQENQNKQNSSGDDQLSQSNQENQQSEALQENESDEQNQEAGSADQQDENQNSGDDASTSTSSEEQKDQPGQDGQKTSLMDQRELTQEEARMLLERYQQTKEPKGLLNFQKQQPRTPVFKDW